MILMTSLCLTTGCARIADLLDPPEPPDPQVFFCLNTEQNEFTQAEIDMRTSRGWTANLARQYRINERRDRWCVS
jgi:hypothetical protein